MKTVKFILVLLFVDLLTSCMSTSYFQVYKATPSDKIVKKDNNLIFEDDNCKVIYNLWDEYGNIGFYFFNKTDKSIYLNTAESFFIVNGISYNYYLNRVFTTSTSSGIATSRGTSESSSIHASKSMTGFNSFDLLQTNTLSASNSISTNNNIGITSSNGYSISYYEEKIICIPSKTAKRINEYKIYRNRLVYCELLKYPTKKGIKTKIFSKNDSPIIFSNRIAYFIDKPDNLIRLENEFYISEITNYPKSEIVESKFNEFCGQKDSHTTDYFTIDSPDKFYIKYTMDLN